MNLSITKYLNFPVLLLLLFFTTEAYFKIVLYSTGEMSGLLKVTKGVILFGLISHLLFKNLKRVYLIGVVFIFFSLGQLTLANSFSNDILIAFVKLN